jgi:hypothetical protein
MIEKSNDLWTEFVVSRTYREICDEMIARTGDSFITHQWISEKLRRSEDWVRRH